MTGLDLRRDGGTGIVFRRIGREGLSTKDRKDAKE